MSRCTAVRDARPGRTRAGAGAAAGCGAGSACARASPAAHACGSPAGRAGDAPRRTPAGSRRSGSARRPRRSPARPRPPADAWRRPATGAASARPVDRLPRDLQHARHDRDLETAVDQLARPGDALAHSQPRNASPQSQARRSCDPTPARARGSAGAALLPGPLLPARQRHLAALQQLVAPAVVQRVGDLVITAHLLNRSTATQTGKHDLDFLLRRPGAVLLGLAQRHLLRRAAHPERRPGHDSRVAATRLGSDRVRATLSQSPVNARTGSEPTATADRT
jgi:hypothetical protein